MGGATTEPWPLTHSLIFPFRTRPHGRTGRHRGPESGSSDERSQEAKRRVEEILGSGARGGASDLVQRDAADRQAEVGLVPPAAAPLRPQRKVVPEQPEDANARAVIEAAMETLSSYGITMEHIHQDLQRWVREEEVRGSAEQLPLDC